MIGQLLVERYLILNELGKGGFSETFLARDKYLPQYPLCVVKQLKLPTNSPVSLEMAQQCFATEAQILAQFGAESGAQFGSSHPQIPTLLAYCQAPDQVYLVQEYIEGESLHQWVAQGRRLTATAAIALLLDLLPVLDYIHSHQVIHRDIKPSNLIRRHADGKIVLIDFGAAGWLGETPANAGANAGAITGSEPDASDHNELIIGTPGYMPPEQDLGQCQFNSDLYALGMLVIHLLTGVEPQQWQPDPITGAWDWQSHWPDAPRQPQLLAILNQMVQLDGRDRYQRATEVLAALQNLALAKPARQLRPQDTPRWFQTQTPRPVFRPVFRLVALVVLVLGVAGGLYRHQTHGFALALLSQWPLASASTPWRSLQQWPLPVRVDEMLITPNNQVLVTAGADRVVRLWSLPTGAPLLALPSGRSGGKVTALSVSADSRWLVSGSGDGTVRLWQVATGQLQGTFQASDQAVTTVAISPDAQTVVGGGRDGKLRLWAVATGALVRSLTLPKVALSGPGPANAAVTAVAYGATSAQLFSASSDRQIQIWNGRSGTLMRTFTGHRETIVGLQAVDADTLLSFGRDRTLQWDLKREELGRVFPSESAVTHPAQAHQHNLVTVNAQGTIRGWTNVAGKAQPRDAPFGIAPASILGQLGQTLNFAISPNQRYCVSQTVDRQLHLWQLNF